MSRGFNGTSDSILVNETPLIDTLLTGSFTFAAWVNIDPNTSFESAIWGVDSSAIAPAFLILNSGGSILFGASTNATVQDAQSVSVPNFLPASAWIHLAASYNDSTDRTIHLYVDGNEITSAQYQTKTPALGTISNTAGPILIGTFLNEIFYKGLLAELRIYNAGLTAAQILAIAQDRGGNVIPVGAGMSPIVYLHLCGVQSPEPDSSGNGNVGVLSGTSAGGPNGNSPGFDCGFGAAGPNFFPLPFDLRTTAAVTVFAAMTVASPAPVGIQQFTTNASTLSMLQQSYAKLVTIYQQLRQDFATDLGPLESAINAAVIAVAGLNTTVQAMVAPTGDAASRFATMQTIIANALQQLLKVQNDE